MSIKTWQDVLLEVVETDPADFTDRENICISPKDLGEILRAALQERDAEIERLRVQLAGCGVAALGNTEASKLQRAKPEDYGYSESYAEVCRAVDREIAQRKVLETALSALQGLVADIVDCQTITHRKAIASAAITAIQQQLK